MSILVEFEVFTKTSLLNPRLVIPMLQIVLKHLKVSLIVYFLTGLSFLRSLLALTVIWRVSITALLMVCDPDKYTITVFQNSRKHNLFCLKWTLWGTDGEKHLMCNFIWFLHYSRLSVSMIFINSLKEKRESLIALYLTAFVVLIIYLFEMNTLKWFLHLIICFL